MKTKKLIELLQEVDPSGELEVNADGYDVFVVDKMPGYYDGPYEVLIRDEDCEYYNIRGGQVRYDGMKVVIQTLSVRSAYLEAKVQNDPFQLELCPSDMTLGYSWQKERFDNRVSEWNEEANNIRDMLAKIRETREETNE